MADTGIVLLAVPDKRFCFDYFRPVTLTGEVIAAHRDARTRHTRLTAFSQIAYSSTTDHGTWWGQHEIQGLTLVYSALDDAHKSMLELDEAGEYVDYHAWVFTPSSFQLILLELNALGYIALKVDAVFPVSGCEFIVHLRRCEEREMDGSALAARRRDLLLQHIRELAACTDFLRPVSEGGCGEMQVDIGELQGRCDAQANEIAELRAQVAALRDSTSWRLTAPMRGAKTLLRRAKQWIPTK
jgi:hypothetical protein